MSRAYRIRVKESLKKVVRGHDRVSTQLEILEVLPCEQMAQLLEKELQGRGFERKGAKMQRKQNGVTVSIEPDTGIVTVSAEVSEKVALEGERETRSYTDVGPSAQKTKEALREQLREDLEKQAKDRETQLQTQATDRLEGELRGLRRELDEAVNRVTAESLKQKARQLGQIKEMTEDPASGSLTIVLEV
ncbi:MAG: hypothetical protein K2R98_17675 [Gemmataceae bacterium]|nr:hypothetical protein [Gemmataceae bacterium]